MPCVYAAADLHGNLFDVPSDCDVLLLAGDICPDFPGFGRRGHGIDRTGTRQSNWLEGAFDMWLRELFARGVKVVGTWGNHDFIQRVNPCVTIPMLVDDETEVRGIRVWGTPWVPNLPFWAWHASKRMLETRADTIPEGLDILMTHGPPFGAGDHVLGAGHVGDSPLRAAIKRAKPKVVICGHVHEGRGTHEVDGIPVYNVAAVDECYEPYPNPFVRLYEF